MPTKINSKKSWAIILIKKKTVHVQICTKILWGKTKKQPKYQQVYLAKKQQILVTFFFYVLSRVWLFAD